MAVFIQALLFGAVLSATDPVAVVVSVTRMHALITRLTSAHDQEQFMSTTRLSSEATCDVIHELVTSPQAILKDVGAGKALSVSVEAESLLNDGGSASCWIFSLQNTKIA